MLIYKGLILFLSYKGSGKLFRNDNRCIECIDGLIEKDLNFGQLIYKKVYQKIMFLL